MKKLLRPPQQGSKLTSTEGNPTTHHYRWMDGVTETVSDLNTTTTTLTTDVATLDTTVAGLSTALTNLTNTVNAIQDLHLVRGTAYTFTGQPSYTFPITIPSYARRISIVFNDMAVANSNIGVRFGTSAGIDSNATYSQSFMRMGSNSTFAIVGSGIQNYHWASSQNPFSSMQSVMTYYNYDGNIWFHHCSHNNLSGSVTYNGNGTGSKTLSGPLTTVQIVSDTGANITAGTVNIFYE